MKIAHRLDPVSIKALARGWGDGSVGMRLPCMREDPSSIPVLDSIFITPAWWGMFLGSVLGKQRQGDSGSLLVSQPHLLGELLPNERPSFRNRRTVKNGAPVHPGHTT